MKNRKINDHLSERKGNVFDKYEVKFRLDQTSIVKETF